MKDFANAIYTVILIAILTVNFTLLLSEVDEAEKMIIKKIESVQVCKVLNNDN